jgi:hypothetical protein
MDNTKPQTKKATTQARKGSPVSDQDLLDAINALADRLPATERRMIRFTVQEIRDRRNGKDATF